MTAPAPMMVRLDRWAELSVRGDDDDNVILQFDRPDAVMAADLEFKLTVDEAVDLIERLVGRVSEIKGTTPPPDGAGPFSSTF